MISRRRPRRSASATTTRETITPARAMASAAPSAASLWLKVSCTASAFWVNSAPLKLAKSAASESVASRDACWAVKGTGGTIASRRGGGGAGRSSTRASIRRASPASSARAATHAWNSTNQPKNGTWYSPCASSRSTVRPSSPLPPAVTSAVTSAESVVFSKGTAVKGAGNWSVPTSAATPSTTACAGASIVTSTERRTCGMLRAPPSRGEDQCRRSRPVTAPPRSR